MSAGLGRYGISAATIATLNQIRGAQAPTPGPAPASPPLDPDSPEAWAQAAAEAGAPGAVKTGPVNSPNPFAASNQEGSRPEPKDEWQGVDSRGFGISSKTTHDSMGNPIVRGPDGKPMIGPQAAADMPRGPAEDTFPIVKGQGEYETTEPVQGAYGGGGQASVTVPAHWQPGTHSVTVQRGIDPEALRPAMEEHELSARHGAAAADARRESMMKAGEGDALYAAGRQLASEEAGRKIAQIQRDRDHYVMGQQKKFDELNARAQKQVDPDAFWKERGTGTRVAAAIAIAANQFAVMWRGKGQNVALQMINEAVDENIKSQQANISNARAALDKEEGLYARNLAEFGDRERAVLATKAQYLDQVAALADAKRAEAKTPEAEAAYHDFRRQIYKERSDLAARFGQLTADHATETMNERFMPAMTVGGAAGVKGKDDHYVPTLGGYARSKEDAAKLNQKGALRMQITENMRQISALMERGKKLNSVTDWQEIGQLQEQLDSLVDDALTKNTVLEGQGAMSESDKQIAASAKGLRGLKIRWQTDAAISRSQQNVEKAARNVLSAHRMDREAYGIQQGREQYVQGPAGPTPVQRLEGRNATVSKRTLGHDDLIQKPQGVEPKK